MLDRSKVREIRDAIQTCLDQHFEMEGITCSVGNGRFGSNNVTFKLDCATINDDGSVNTQMAEDFKRCAAIWGLSPDDLGREFLHGGDTMKIIGGKPKARKNQIIVENIHGKQYVMPASSVKLFLSAALKS